MKRIYCRACNACGLQPVLNLGRQAPANTLKTDAVKYPLELVVCRACGLLQLDYDVPGDVLFDEDYPLYSASVPGTVARSKECAEYLTKRLCLTDSSLVVEIGGNDGTLLKQFKTNILNYERAPGPAKAAMRAGTPTMRSRWGSDVSTPVPADLIIANNVMAHDPDLRSFVAGVARNLNRGGTFVAEFPWALRMIENAQFDTIYHEHYSYFSLRALIPLFTELGLQVYDVQELPDFHGGSLRIYATHIGKRAITASIYKFMELEKPLTQMETLIRFRDKAYSVKADMEAFLFTQGTIFAYGAAAKGSTFINWLGLDWTDIFAVGDSSPEKIGRHIPGTSIPIISEDALLLSKPSHVWILPWNWATQIGEKLCAKGYTGKFVTAIPELKVF